MCTYVLIHTGTHAYIHTHIDTNIIHLATYLQACMYTHILALDTYLCNHVSPESIHALMNLYLLSKCIRCTCTLVHVCRLFALQQRGCVASVLIVPCVTKQQLSAELAA